MKNTFKVSVIIPAYNSEDFISRAINSALSQTYGIYEIIIIDDGSIDNTNKIVKNYQNKDSRIVYYWQNNYGAPANPTNEGIKKAKGDYIAILEHDDEWLPEKIEKQIEVIKTNNSIGLVSCSAFSIKNNKNKIVKSFQDNKNIFIKLLESNRVFSASSVLIPRKVFDDVGLFDENLKNAQDWEMWIRIAQAGYSFQFIKEPLFNYHIHGDNLSHISSLEKREDDLNYIYNKYKKYYKKDNKLFSNKLRYDGTRYMLMNKLNKGRERLIKSIKINPFNFLSYLYLLLSFFGSENYRKLTELKSKI